MPYATAVDGTRLYYEEAGDGTPVVFVHEFAGDWRTWEAQVRALSRGKRCVTFSARGYPPSDVPTDGARYSQDIARQDVIALMDHLKIDRAHIVGHSMGSYTALHVGIRNPQRCISLVATGCGFTSNPATRAAAERQIDENVRMFAQEEMAVAAAKYADQPMRFPHRRKDPRGFAEFVQHLAEHSGIGSSLTMANIQRKRPTLGQMEPDLRKLRLPLLVITGDEDADCLDA